jgi:O-antigen ligase
MLKKLIDKIKENYFISFIYLYVLLLPWNFSNGQMGLLSITLLVWWLTLGKKNNYFSKLKDIFTFKPLLLLILFLLWSYLSLFWTDNFDSARVALKYYKYYWILIPVLFTSLTQKEAINAFYFFIISLGLYALFSLSIAIGIVDIIDCTTNPNCQSNPRGILPYAIVTPYMAIATLSAFTIRSYLPSGKIKILFLFFSIIALIVLCLNNGRAAQFAFIVTFIGLLFIHRDHIFNRKTILGILLFTSISVYTLNATGQSHRITSALHELNNLEEKEYAGSFGMRAYMWVAANSLIPHHPVIGAGAGDNIDEFVEFTKTHPSKAVWLRSYHNQHLDTLTKYGIIGYLLLWGSILSLLLSLRKLPQYFTLAFIFFSTTFFDGIGDIILLMKPYNNVFILVFLLFSIISFQQTKRKQ